MHRLFLLGLLALLIVIPASGQSEQATEPPRPDYIIDDNAALLFPEAVVTEFLVSRPAADFEALTVQFSQENWQSEQIELDPQQIGQDNFGNTLFSFVWPIPEDNPPRLFETITARWRFIEPSGEAGEVLMEFDFADSRTGWSVTEEGAVRLASPANRAVSAGFIREDVDRLYTLMRENTGGQSTRGIILYDNTLTLDPCPDDTLSVPAGFYVSITIDCDGGKVTRLYNAAGWRVVTTGLLTYESAMNAISIELVRDLYRPLWSAGSVPAWFEYGLALFYSPTDKTSLLEQARQAARIGSLLPDVNSIPQEEGRRALWEAQSYGYVIYMAEQIGVSRLFSLAGSLGSTTLAEAYRGAANRSLDSLFASWPDWIFSVPAAGAFQYNPYLPTTPTPTATQSRTPFPPTATRTPTATLTATPTPTVTGVLSPTPRIETPTAAFTPTITLRPPGSVSFPMPRAADSAAEQTPAPAETPILPLIIGGGIGILVIVGFILFMTRRGRKRHD